MNKFVQGGMSSLTAGDNFSVQTPSEVCFHIPYSVDTHELTTRFMNQIASSLTYIIYGCLVDACTLPSYPF